MKRIFCFVIAIAILCSAAFCVGYTESEATPEEVAAAREQLDPEGIFDPYLLGMDVELLDMPGFEPDEKNGTDNYVKNIVYYGFPASAIILTKDNRVYATQYIIHENGADELIMLKNMMTSDTGEVYGDNQLTPSVIVDGISIPVYDDTLIREAIDDRKINATFLYQWDVSPPISVVLAVRGTDASVGILYLEYQ